ncbi:hypothetical protein KNP414_01480 [Paenibacillus mucilaginosus KNP414]|uniref:Uncharacterized protein n=1 Tax=Paenibacillus mucilaginosus (strain KNP414) TaxID=1036673 RepID=F8FMG1_PAEMK|nr:hypothetical protein KNP414_01480 [Paenibacillus mucilaginosus KNP414]
MFDHVRTLLRPLVSQPQYGAKPYTLMDEREGPAVPSKPPGDYVP